MNMNGILMNIRVSWENGADLQVVGSFFLGSRGVGISGSPSEECVGGRAGTLQARSFAMGGPPIARFHSSGPATIGPVGVGFGGWMTME